MAIKIGINGFGRIGRYFTRIALQNKDIEIIAINDLAPVKTLAHLLKYDSVHGRFNGTISTTNTAIVANGKSILITSHKNPADIPWKDLGVDIVVESTGLFLTRETASAHLTAGAKKVVLSAPPNSADIKAIVMGVNDNILDGSEDIISNASCTTNSAAPLVAVMKKLGKIESCYITTYTRIPPIRNYTTPRIKICDGHGQLLYPLFQPLPVQPKPLPKYFLNWKATWAVVGCGFRYLTAPLPT